MSAERVTPSRIGIRASNSILTSWVGFDAFDVGSSAWTGAAGGKHRQDERRSHEVRRADTDARDTRIDHSTGRLYVQVRRAATNCRPRRGCKKRAADGVCLLQLFPLVTATVFRKVNYHRDRQAGSMASQF